MRSSCRLVTSMAILAWTPPDRQGQCHVSRLGRDTGELVSGYPLIAKALPIDARSLSCAVWVLWGRVAWLDAHVAHTSANALRRVLRAYGAAPVATQATASTKAAEKRASPPLKRWLCASISTSLVVTVSAPNSARARAAGRYVSPEA
jgi:hypothetical protein